MSNLIIRTVASKKDLRSFIHLPFAIHKNHSNWLPPLITDEKKVFDEEKNRSFAHSETILLLAERENKVVGRIMGIINSAYNQTHNEKNARFFAMETYDDESVFDTLLAAVERWAKDNGMDKLVGPIGFSDKDPQGFLLSGFNDPVSIIVTNHSFEYMIKHMKRNKYSKSIDLVQYRADVPREIPSVYENMSQRVIDSGYQILEFTKTKTIRPYIPEVFALLNKTYTEIYGFAPLDDKEIAEFSERFLPFLDARFIKIVVDQQKKIVAFLVAMPDISKGMHKANGKLFPFGFMHILRSGKKSKQLNLLLGSIEESIRNKGIVSLLAVKVVESAQKARMEIFDSHLIMEDNTKMRAIYERFDAKIYKTYRIFQKNI
ncbi:MAG: hypothetical protein PF484_03395 [Bacteroidales bacterium]|jgi:hypothetical protein|nr:hypothetical protein [Bacteroidales bacterium]